MSKLALDNAGAPAGAPLSILNVIPPDEYADHKINSAYTNHGAIQTLTYAAAVARLLGEPNATAAAWEDAARRIVRPHNASGAAGG
jgi:trehalose/maltose hydrolase-like predicted phosphorylase